MRRTTEYAHEGRDHRDSSKAGDINNTTKKPKKRYHTKTTIEETTEMRLIDNDTERKQQTAISTLENVIAVENNGNHINFLTTTNQHKTPQEIFQNHVVLKTTMYN